MGIAVKNIYVNCSLSTIITTTKRSFNIEGFVNIPRLKTYRMAEHLNFT